MLNDRVDRFPASRRERRLCARVLAGCVFNELLPANSDLANGFLAYSGRAYESTCHDFGIQPNPAVGQIIESLRSDLVDELMRIELIHHTYQGGEAIDRGEALDVLISGRSALLAIDCDSTIRWSHGQDANYFGPRVGESRPETARLQVLLATRRAWALAQAGACPEASGGPHLLCNYLNSPKPADAPLAVLYWEDVLALVSRFVGPRPLISYLFTLLDY